MEHRRADPATPGPRVGPASRGAQDLRPVVVDGTALSLTDLDDLAHGRARAVVDREVLAGLDVLHEAMLAARERGAVYGATTGVGANRHVAVDFGLEPRDVTGSPDHPDHDEAAGHGMRLLRSHAATLGPREEDVTVRAALVIRMNQLLAGVHAGAGAGISPPVLAALAEAVETGAVPTLHRFGGIGTSDLAALAELGLTLVGERPWAVGDVPAAPLGVADALPLISSNAVTLATASLALVRVREQLRAALAVGALAFLALRGNGEAWADRVHATRAHPWQRSVAAAVTELVAAAGDAARLQDPFGLRTLPQVMAPAFADADHLEDVLVVESSAPAENPLISPDAVFHHGQFHAATLAAALDSLRTSTYAALTLSAARLALLLRPEHTGLRAFLATGPQGSSGLMIGEYVVQDALAELRPGTLPSSSATVSISLGVEEHASFATQGARALGRVADLAPLVLGMEAVAAVRALRTAPERLAASAVAVFAAFDEVLDRDERDHAVGPDVHAVSSRFGVVAALVPLRP